MAEARLNLGPSRWTPMAAALLAAVSVVTGALDASNALWPVTVVCGIGAMVAAAHALYVTVARHSDAGAAQVGLFLIAACSWFSAGPALIEHANTVRGARVPYLFFGGMLVLGVALAVRVIVRGLPFNQPAVFRPLRSGPPPLRVLRQDYLVELPIKEAAERLDSAIASLPILNRQPLLNLPGGGTYGFADPNRLVLHVSGFGVAQFELQSVRISQTSLGLEIGSTTAGAALS